MCGYNEYSAIVYSCIISLKEFMGVIILYISLRTTKPLPLLHVNSLLHFVSYLLRDNNKHNIVLNKKIGSSQLFGFDDTVMASFAFLMVCKIILLISSNEFLTVINRLVR